MNWRSRTLLLAAALPGCSLFLEDNPKFIDTVADGGDTEGDTGSTELGMCPDGTLDCDDEPGCESNANDPNNCGGCDEICELDGELLECVDGQCVGTVVFTELADAYVDSNFGSQNFGTDTRLVVDSSRSSFIALPDISGLPSGATLETVRLHLSCTQAGTSLQLQRVESEWDELELTADNAPSGSEVIGQIELTRGANEIDIAGMFPSWRAGDPRRSLELSSVGPDPQPLVCSSREGSTPPSLQITLRW